MLNIKEIGNEEMENGKVIYNSGPYKRVELDFNEVENNVIQINKDTIMEENGIAVGVSGISKNSVAVENIDVYDLNLNIEKNGRLIKKTYDKVSSNRNMRRIKRGIEFYSSIEAEENELFNNIYVNVDPSLNTYYSGGEVINLNDENVIDDDDGSENGNNNGEGNVNNNNSVINIQNDRLYEINENDNYNILPEDGYDVMSHVLVSVNVDKNEIGEIEDKNVNENGEIDLSSLIPEGKDGISGGKIVVDVPQAVLDDDSTVCISNIIGNSNNTYEILPEENIDAMKKVTVYKDLQNVNKLERRYESNNTYIIEKDNTSIYCGAEIVVDVHDNVADLSDIEINEDCDILLEELVPEGMDGISGGKISINTNDIIDDVNITENGEIDLSNLVPMGKEGIKGGKINVNVHNVGEIEDRNIVENCEIDLSELIPEGKEGISGGKININVSQVVNDILRYISLTANRDVWNGTNKSFIDLENDELGMTNENSIDYTIGAYNNLVILKDSESTVDVKVYGMDNSSGYNVVVPSNCYYKQIVYPVGDKVYFLNNYGRELFSVDLNRENINVNNNNVEVLNCEFSINKSIFDVPGFSSVNVGNQLELEEEKVVYLSDVFNSEDNPFSVLPSDSKDAIEEVKLVKDFSIHSTGASYSTNGIYNITANEHELFNDVQIVVNTPVLDLEEEKNIKLSNIFNSEDNPFSVLPSNNKDGIVKLNIDKDVNILTKFEKLRVIMSNSNNYIDISLNEMIEVDCSTQIQVPSNSLLIFYVIFERVTDFYFYYNNEDGYSSCRFRDSNPNGYKLYFKILNDNNVYWPYQMRLFNKYDEVLSIFGVYKRDAKTVNYIGAVKNYSTYSFEYRRNKLRYIGFNPGNGEYVDFYNDKFIVSNNDTVHVSPGEMVVSVRDERSSFGRFSVSVGIGRMSGNGYDVLISSGICYFKKYIGNEYNVLNVFDENKELVFYYTLIIADDNKKYMNWSGLFENMIILPNILINN